jgi:hypothetical protein
MSLGLLGDYGSESEISDSDGEYERASGDRNDNQTSTKTDNKTEPLIGMCNNAAEGESEGSGREGDPLSFIQGDASSSDNGSSSDEEAPTDDKDTTAAVPLPLPDLDQLTSPTGQETTTFSSVFSNPYKEAEEAKLSMLKRHVSEFAPDEKPPSRQERSRQHRFKGTRGNRGSRAPRHGSELQASDARHTPGGSSAIDSQRFFNDDDSCVVSEGGEFAHHDGGVKRKQRSGVSSTLVPPKKYLKSYGRAQAEERPWTVGSLTDSHKR